MDLVKVNSSTVSAVGWKNDLLVVRFNSGAVYIYNDVKENTYNDLVKAESVGRFLNENIKSKYSYTKLTD